MTKKESLKVLVYGASGAQAFPLLRELAGRGHEPLAVTHSPEKTGLLEKEGVNVALADMKARERLREINKGMDAVCLLLPFFTEHPDDILLYAENALEAGKEAGIKKIVWNSSTIIPETKTGNPVTDTRLQVLEMLKSSKIPYVVLQPGLYAENLLGPWTVQYMRKEHKLAYPFPEWVPVGWLSARELAGISVAALESPEAEGKSFCISGKRTYTGNELAQEFSAVLGKNILYHPLHPDEFGSIVDEAFGPGAGEKVAAVYRSMWETNGFPPSFFDMAPVKKFLPGEQPDLRDWIREHRDRFL